MIYSPIQSPIRAAVLSAQRIAVGVAPAWSPGTAWFSAGEPGLWYDPTDLSTMFQDSAGTTPVTAVEQPVGRILDKSGRGNHATQATSTARPTLRNRYNLLTFSEQFDNAVWVKSGMFVTANAGTAPDGSNTAESGLSPSNSPACQSYQIGLPLVSGGTYRASCWLKQLASPWAVLNVYSTTPGDRRVYFNLSTGSVGTTAAGVTATITAAANGWYYCTATFVAGSNSGGLSVECVAADGNPAGVTSNSILMWGASLVTAADASLPYQRIAAATDYDSDTTKFPLYLAFDGSDDSLATGNVDFSASDKMTVVAGASKLSDVTGILAELSTNTGANNGSFYVVTGNDSGVVAPTGGNGYTSLARGTSGTVSANGQFIVQAPDKAVIGVTHDIAGDLSILRRNGVAGASAIGDKGAGNFGNYPVFIGRRGGSSLPFNGRLHQLIIRGAVSANIAQAESFTATKTGVTL